MSEGVGNLEEQSLKRKERLKALKRKANQDNQLDNNENSTKKSASLPKPKFRSYKPADEELKQLALDETKPGNVEEQVKIQLDASLDRSVFDSLDVSNLAPRKPDWDLKRDAAKKLERLEKRTQRAIAELIRARLRTDMGEDLAANVAIGAELQATEVEE